MSFTICHHLKEDGRICQSPAVRGQRYCYYHSEWRLRRMALAQARARGERIWIELPPLEDLRAVQAAVSHVTEAIAARVIDRKDARLLLTSLRLAANNFKAAKAFVGSSPYQVDTAYETIASYPNLVQEYGLPPNIDLDADPEQVYPPPLAEAGTPPLPRRVGPKRTAVGCVSYPGWVDSGRWAAPEDQLAFIRGMREAVATAFDRKPPAPVPPPPGGSGKAGAAGKNGA